MYIAWVVKSYSFLYSPMFIRLCLAVFVARDKQLSERSRLSLEDEASAGTRVVVLDVDGQKHHQFNVNKMQLTPLEPPKPFLY